MTSVFTALNRNRPTFYAFSLPEHADSLSIRRAYGNNGQGVAIGAIRRNGRKRVLRFESCDSLQMAYRTEAEFVGMFTCDDLQSSKSTSDSMLFIRRGGSRPNSERYFNRG